ncbi:hypothetical protein ABIE67_003151 [Streptomyces sp. V4I8]
MWHSQVAAQHVDAHLAFLRPLIGKPRHRIRTSHAYSRLVCPELFGCGAEPFDQCLVVLAGVGGLAEVLAPVGDHECDHAADACDNGQRDLDGVVCVAGFERTGYPHSRCPQHQPQQS